MCVCVCVCVCACVAMKSLMVRGSGMSEVKCVRGLGRDFTAGL